MARRNESFFKRSWSLDQVAAMAIHGIHLLNIFSRTEQSMILKLGMQHRVFEYYQIPSNDDLSLTFDLLTQRSTLVPDAFVWENA